MNTTNKPSESSHSPKERYYRIVRNIGLLCILLGTPNAINNRENPSKGDEDNKPDIHNNEKDKKGHRDKPVTITTFNVENETSRMSQAEQKIFGEIFNQIQSDIIALQEVQDAETLVKMMKHVQGEFIALIDGESSNNQRNLAFILRVRKDVAYILDTDQEILAQGENIMVYDVDDDSFFFPDPEDDTFFPERRDGLFVSVEMPGVDGPVTIITTHAKSRRGGRERTSERRVGASKMVIQKIQKEYPGSKIIFCGDFNDTPSSKSIQALETGDPNANAKYNHNKGKYFYNTTENNANAGEVTIGLGDEDIPTNKPLNTVIAGRHEHDFANVGENTHTGPQFFDQILVKLMGKLKATVHKDPYALKVSDHLPVSITIGGETKQFTPGIRTVTETTIDLTEIDAVQPPIIMPEGKFQRNIGELGALQIVQLVPNPHGPDEGNEEVTLRNTSDQPVPLVLYTIKDAHGNTLELPNISIQPGNTHTINCGGGFGEFSLNNKGDKVTVIGADGTTSDSVSYQGARNGEVFQ